MSGLGVLFDLERILLFGLLLARAGGMVATAPFLAGRMVPRTVKALFVGTLALVMVPLSAGPAVPERLSSLVAMFAGELAIGLALGFAAQLFVLAFQIAGELVGYQMGFGMARVIDPRMNVDSTIMGRWFWLIGMTLFFTLGGPELLIRGVAGTLQLVPPGLAAPGGDMAAALLRFSADTFSAALGVAAPAVGILLLTSMALGILARTVPQMNVFIVGFPLKITAGIVGVALTIPFLAGIAHRELGTLARRLAALAGA
jgi:flagellar biosynthetic protein FliR